jgi:hypothetical protein
MIRLLEGKGDARNMSCAPRSVSGSYLKHHGLSGTWTPSSQESYRFRFETEKDSKVRHSMAESGSYRITPRARPGRLRGDPEDWHDIRQTFP